jgi:hypothetical protein
LKVLIILKNNLCASEVRIFGDFIEINVLREFVDIPQSGSEFLKFFMFWREILKISTGSQFQKFSILGCFPVRND